MDRAYARTDDAPRDINIERPVPYLFDQLCLVALPAALGAICIVLSRWQTGTAWRIFTLCGAAALVLLAGMRAVIVVFRVMSAKRITDWPQQRSWAPWRYVVLLAPILLFMLGWPQNLQSAAKTYVLEPRRQAEIAATLLAMGPPSLPQLGLLPMAGDKLKIVTVDLVTLRNAAQDPDLRRAWEGVTVQIRGEFRSNQVSKQTFHVWRLRFHRLRNGDDSVLIPVVAGEDIDHAHGWVSVVGRVDFRNGGRGVETVLRIRGREDVVPTSRDVAEANPYVR